MGLELLRMRTTLARAELLQCVVDVQGKSLRLFYVLLLDLALLSPSALEMSRGCAMRVPIGHRAMEGHQVRQ